MDNNLASPKRRIIKLIKNKKFKVSTFFYDIGDNYENYKGKRLDTMPNIDILVKLRTKIPDMNIEWILTGEGEMFLPETTEAAAKSGGNEILRELIHEKDSRIEDLIRENERLRIEINTLRNGPEPVA